MDRDINMKRLCIYVTYNKENEIKEYMGYMLKALRGYTTTLYVVCNYLKISDGLEHIVPYADDIFYRENKGLDAGAYKDMLCNIIGWDAVYQYDELILMNDSFLGPFYDFGRYFTLMKDIACDFWGWTRNFGGEYAESFIGKYESHIQSYYLLFRSRAFKSNQFRNFWEDLLYPETYNEAIFYFEHGINNLLKREGFIPMAVTDVWGMVFEYNENPYRLYSLELIRDKGFPVLKKKSIQITNAGFDNAIKAVEYIEMNNLYPANLIWDLVDSQFYIENYAPAGVNCLAFFYGKFKKIYIYGAGVCGKNLKVYFEHKHWQHKGFIVTNKSAQDTECIHFDDIQIDDETGIIISVIRQKVSEEIVNYIKTKSNCRREQLFVVYDCKAIRLSD